MQSVSDIELPDCRQRKNDGKWALSDLAENEETDPGKARQLLRQLTQLNIQDIYAKADKPLTDPVDLSIRLELTGGESWRYDFIKKDGQGHALLKVFGDPFLFKIGTSVMKDIQETTRSKLVKPREAAAPPTPESGEKKEKLEPREMRA